MKTIRYLFFGALLLLTGSFSLNAQVNMVPNGNFEQVDADGNIASWGFDYNINYDGIAGIVSADKAVFKEGKQSGYFTSRTAINWIKDIPGNKTYDISFWYRSNAPAGVKPTISLLGSMFAISNGSPDDMEKLAANHEAVAGEWLFVEVKGIKFPETTQDFILYFQSNDDNGFWLDDVKIVEAGTTTKTAQTITGLSAITKTTSDADFDLTATASSNLAVSYSSSNTAVATVTGSKVHIVGAGTSTITASQAGDGTYAAAPDVTATLTVSSTAVAVTSVTLNKTTLALTAGGTGTLTAMLAPETATNKNVSWTSSNTAIATVDNTGKVTAVAAGTATITVTTTDGSKTATCAVTVTAASVAVTGVTLNKTTLALTAGGTETLAATLAPETATNKNVSWTSSNTAIATVDNTGKVTAVAAGTATITVTTVDGSKTATCAATVTAASVAVTGVTLNKTTLALTVGGTEILTATLAPNNATNTNVTWSSGDVNIATVDNAGKVTAVAAGTATITVTTTDGSKTATCAVTVTASTVAVTGVTLNKTTLALTAGGTETLTATLAPETATNKNVTWSSSDVNIATVDNAGKVTAVAAGTATITVTTVDGSKTATCAVTVTAAVSYTWLLAPAIAVEGTNFKVVGTDADKFTLFYIDDQAATATAGVVSLASKTGDLSLKATTADGTGFIKLKVTMTTKTGVKDGVEVIKLDANNKQ